MTWVLQDQQLSLLNFNKLKMKKNKQRFFAQRTGILACLLLFLSAGLQAQTKTISGTVVDATGETVIAASVVVKGTTIGTVTDFDGHYTLDVPADAQTLVFSFMGMKTEEVAITGSVINVTLQEDTQLIDEVVVTGYGTTKKRDLVTSVSSVSAEQLKDIPVTSAAEAIQGKMAGVQVTTTEGSPDAEIKIRVRGGGSLTQSNDPLYIVDGFPVSSISDIPPTDIQSIDVLKDAAATAIYGAQGANGVIIITTKDASTTGEKNTITVDYNGYVGWKRMANKYEMMNARDYTLLQYEYAYLNANGRASGIASNFSKYFDQYYIDNGSNSSYQTSISELLDYWGNSPATEWQRATFGPTWGESLNDAPGSALDGLDNNYNHQGFNSNHSVSVSGGNKNANFNLSYNRIDDDAIMYASNYKRDNISFKGKFKPIKDITIGVTARYTNTEILGAGSNTSEDSGSKTQSRVRNAVAYTPVTLLSRDDNNIDDYESYGSLFDPITTINHNWQTKSDEKYTLNGYASWKFAKKFTLRTEVGYEGRYQNRNRYYGPTSYYSRSNPAPAFIASVTGSNESGAMGMGNVIVRDDIDTRLRNSNTFEYKDEWGDGHNFSLLLGEETIVNHGEEKIFYGYGYETTYTGEDIFNYLNQAIAFDYSNTIAANDNMLSFFGRANYDYMGRYYLTATMRADASTRFSQGNQWGYFPSVAVAWRMSDESWMKGASNWLSNLKWRFSYGTAGNNNVDLGYLDFNYASSTTSYTGAFGGGTATILTSGGSDKICANPDLKWETTITRDLGLDYGFFNERLSGALDLYLNNTRDLILLFNLPAGGYNYQYRNIGSTENRGIDFSIRGIALDHNSKRLSYGLTIDANISINRNKVVDLGGMESIAISSSCFSANYQNSYEFLVTEGSPIGQVYGFKTDGWYTAEDFSSYNTRTGQWLDENGNVIETPLSTNGARPGMPKIVDTDGVEGISGDDRTVIGNTMPDFSGGFSLSAYVGGESWGQIDFGANFTYSYGNDVVNLTALDFTTMYNSSKLQNKLQSVAYGNRYSLFTENGDYIPASYASNAVNGILSGDAYIAMAAALNESNSGATSANPVVANLALTDQYVEDASFLRLANLTVGYTLPDKWIEKAHISRLRVYFQASNLFCLTNYSGADPEVDTRSSQNPLAIGVDWSAYPKTRGFNVGLNLSF